MASANTNSSSSQALITPGHPYTVVAGSGVVENKATSTSITAPAVVKAQKQHPSGITGRIN